MDTMKKAISVILVLVLCVSMMAVAAAGSSIGGDNSYYSQYGDDLAEQLRKVPEFKFWHHENGIGYDVCPVYTAPSIYAFRTANGRACVATDYEMYDAGFVDGWLLVRYETSIGGTNVGYIPPQYIQGFKSNWGTREFAYVPVTAAQTIKVTNNPLMPGSAFAIMDPGECFHILGKYNYHYDWWYIECMVDGQVARGFIDRQSSSFYLGDMSYDSYYEDTDQGQAVTIATLGNPAVSPLGTEQIGYVVVQYGTTGARKNVRVSPDPDSSIVAHVEPEDRYPCYASKVGTTGRVWYYIWIEEVSKWGWISSGIATLYYN